LICNEYCFRVYFSSFPQCNISAPKNGFNNVALSF
jgi:hypothetical protein